MPEPPRASTPAGVDAISPDAATAAHAAAVADAFARLNLRLRARMLGRLIRSVGSLALAVVAGGAFAKYIARATAEITVELEDAALATWSQVFDLVCYVAQSDPDRLQRLLDDLSRMGYLIA